MSASLAQLSVASDSAVGGASPEWVPPTPPDAQPGIHVLLRV